MSIWRRAMKRIFSLDEIDRFPGESPRKNLTVAAVILAIATGLTCILISCTGLWSWNCPESYGESV